MANIRCKACGKIYSYEKEGCCPGCGAYNRPPKRERVNPDGTIQHMTDAAYEKRNKAAGKVCFEEKECHEEKVCYEDQTRHGKRKETHKAGQSAAAFLNQFAAAGKGRKKRSRGSGILGAVLAIILAILAGTNVLDRVFEGGFHEDDPVPGSVVVTPADEYSYDAPMGDELVLLDGTTITVNSWTRDDQEKAIIVELEAAFADSDHEFYATLCCIDDEGVEQELNDLTTQTTDEGRLLLHFNAEGYDGLEPFALRVDEWHGDDYAAGWYFDLR